MRKESRSDSKKTIMARNRVRKFRKTKAILKEREILIKNKLSSNNKQLNDFDFNSDLKSKPKDNASFSENLREWAIEHRITTLAINDLLKILICYGFYWLPADYRSFLSTPRNVEITTVANGKLWFNGIGKNLKQVFSTSNRDIIISLKFNVDGLPLFNSSKLQFWPILASIQGKVLKTFVDSSNLNISKHNFHFHRIPMYRTFRGGHLVW